MWIFSVLDFVCVFGEEIGVLVLEIVFLSDEV